MVLTHIVYGLDLIALTLGAGLFVYSKKTPGCGSCFGKLVGIVVMILSILSIACTLSCAMKGEGCHRPGQEGGIMAMPMPTDGADGNEHAKKVERVKK